MREETKLILMITSMKLDKGIVQRRLDLMEADGIVSMLPFLASVRLMMRTFNQTFVPNAHVGVNVDAAELRAENDAVVICTGATWPRDLRMPGRNADGIHFAMEYLQVCTHACLLR